MQVPGLISQGKVLQNRVRELTERALGHERIAGPHDGPDAQQMYCLVDAVAVVCAE